MLDRLSENLSWYEILHEPIWALFVTALLAGIVISTRYNEKYGWIAIVLFVPYFSLIPEACLGLCPGVVIGDYLKSMVKQSEIRIHTPGIESEYGYVYRLAIFLSRRESYTEHRLRQDSSINLAHHSS